MQSQEFPLLTLLEAQALEAKILQDSIVATRTIVKLVGEKLADGIEDCLKIYPPFCKKMTRGSGYQSESTSILILCGKGHNTTDALWAGLYFCEKHPGARITLLFVNSIEDLKPLTQEAFEACKPYIHSIFFYESKEEWLHIQQELEQEIQFDVVLDGIFGLQSREGLPEAIETILHWVNEASNLHLKIAIDLPTGLGGKKAFQADFTFMIGVLKEICFRATARLSVGILRFIDVGFFENEIHEKAEVCVGAGIMRELFRPRYPLTHKYHQGVVGVIGSSDLYPGAGFLATKGALLSGVGLVYAWVPDHLIPTFAAQLPEVIWRSQSTTSLQKDLDQVHLDALVIGPGISVTDDLYDYLRNQIANLSCPIIWDASLLNEALIPILKERKSKGFVNILTPHLGEWRRLSPLHKTVDIVDNKDLKAFSEATSSIIILKKNRLKVATGTKIYHFLEGNPILARGGTGDILAGLLGGIVASPIGRTIRKEKSFQEVRDHILLGCKWYLSQADEWARREDCRNTHTSRMLQL